MRRQERSATAWPDAEGTAAAQDARDAGSPASVAFEVLHASRERRRDLEAARAIRAERRCRLALHGSPVVLFEQDRDLRYTWVQNAPAAFQSGRVLGRTDADLFEPSDAARLVAIKRRVLETGSAAREEVCIGPPDRPMYWDLRVEPRRTAEGAIDGIICSAVDLTERRLTEAALRDAKEAAEQASRAKSEFVSIVSHELRTPLTAVIGLCDILTMEQIGPVNARQKEYLARMKASGWRLVGMIDDLLALSRSEAGRESLRLEHADIAEIAADVARMLATEANGRGLTLELTGAQEPLIARTDAGKVRQILTNLVGNAVRYTEAGGVRIDVCTAGDNVELRVRDTGPGIAPERLAEIFEPFVQLGGRAGRGAGTGLGLPICRRLAAVLGGEIRVESTPGTGSTFTASLPLCSGPA